MNGPSWYGVINSGSSKSFVVYLLAASSLAVASTFFISHGPSSPYGFRDQHVILSSRSVRVWPVSCCYRPPCSSLSFSVFFVAGVWI